MNELNRVSSDVVELLKENNLVVMRDKNTLKPLGISFSEDGLRGLANKNGVYLYCEGRVTNFNEARKAKRNRNIIIEKFIPREFNNRSMATTEIHWANHAKKLIKQY